MKLGLLLAGLLLSAQPAAPAGPASPLPVTGALRMEVTIGTGADGRMSCTMAANGDSQESDLLCAMVMDDQAAQSFGGLPPDVSVTLDIVMALDGEAIPPRSALDRGALVYESSARIGVDQAGRIGNCDMLGGHFRGQLAGLQGAVDPFPLCDVPGLSGQVIFPAAQGAPAPRSGVMRRELYMRHGVTRQTA
ncbi:MAG TPA: hypothetical protein VEC11_01060 [Allosphingosinicella sp.]|nr:hypothetical protein [Allosphingosinicella sp.]